MSFLVSSAMLFAYLQALPHKLTRRFAGNIYVSVSEFRLVAVLADPLGITRQKTYIAIIQEFVPLGEDVRPGHWLDSVVLGRVELIPHQVHDGFLEKTWQT